MPGATEYQGLHRDTGDYLQVDTSTPPHPTATTAT